MEKSNNKFAIEEMGELLQAICKYQRKCHCGTAAEIATAKANLQEEIADVKVVTDQLAFMFDEKEIERIKLEKVKRAVRRAKAQNTEIS